MGELLCMLRRRVAPLMTLTVLSLCACASAMVASHQPASPSRPWCIAREQELDSTLAVAQARRALGQHDIALEPDSIQVIRGKGIELGLLISLVAGGRSNVLGGGGLVWVDIETGCPIVLLRYE